MCKTNVEITHITQNFHLVIWMLMFIPHRDGAVSFHVPPRQLFQSLLIRCIIQVETSSLCRV